MGRGILSTTQGKWELVNLVGQLQPAGSIFKGQQFKKPGVKRVMSPPDTLTAAVDNFIKAFEKLGINLVQQIQTQQQLIYP
jgi:hypothetical protein